MLEPPNPGSVGRADLVATARTLRELGLTESAVADAEAILPRQLDAVRRPLVCAELRHRGDPAATLLRCFVYDDAVSESEAESALPGAALSVLEACGLVVRSGADVRAAGRVVPFLGVLVAADVPTAGAEAVMPPGPTTMQLGRLLPETGLGRVLDVATGPGSLALVAAARGGRAVGTDVSGRALAFARFNAALNALDVDWREGDVLAPVAGERFDLVVGQPPFIPRPESVAGVTFLHAGPVGDELARVLIGGLPDVLAAGGVALVRVDVPTRDEALPAQLRSVLPADRADLAVLTWRGPDAYQESYSYASLHDPTLGVAYAQAAVAYREHMRAADISQFVQAIVVVRAPRGAGAWTAGLPLDAPPDTWSALDRYTGALDAASLADDELLAVRLVPLRGARVVAVRGFADDEGPVMRLTVPNGAIASSGDLGDDMLAVLDAFTDGHAPGPIAVAHAELTGGELAHSRGLVLELVRRALTSGWLVPA